MARSPAKVVNTRGDKFVLTLLKIEAHDNLGRPTQARLVYDEEILQDVMNKYEKENRSVEFLLVYVGEENVKPKLIGSA